MRRILPREVSASDLKFVLALQGAVLAAFCLVATDTGNLTSSSDSQKTGTAAEAAPQVSGEEGVPSDLQREQIRLSNFTELEKDDLNSREVTPEAPQAPTMLQLAALHSSAVALSAPLMASQLSQSANAQANVPTKLVAYSLAKGDGGMFSRARRSRAGRRVASGGGGPGPGPPIGGIGGRGRGGAGGGGGGNCPGSGGR